MEHTNLETLIAESTVRALALVVHIIPAEGEVALTPDLLAVIQDEFGTTLITSSADRLEEARRAGRIAEGPFAVIRLEISLSFGEPGFIAAITGACAGIGISALVLSTFSFDYLLVPHRDLEAAVDALAATGFPVLREDRDVPGELAEK